MAGVLVVLEFEKVREYCYRRTDEGVITAAQSEFSNVKKYTRGSEVVVSAQSEFSKMKKTHVRR